MVVSVCLTQVFSWLAVLTTNYLGNAVEESIWALSALLAVVCVLKLRSRCAGHLKHYLAAAGCAGFLYVCFMICVDVPMYISRYMTNEAMGRSYLSVWDGLHDASRRRVVSLAYDEWESEMPWMTLYFSFCVWYSMSLTNAPRFVPDASPTKKLS